MLKPVCDKLASSEEFLALARAVREGAVNSAVEGIASCSFPLIIAALRQELERQIIVITENSARLYEMVQDLGAFCPEELVFPLPPWETMPYEFTAPSEKTERERIRALYRLAGGNSGIIVTSVEALMRRLPAPEFIMNRGVELRAGEDYPYDDLLLMLSSYGYSRESRVDDYGHFSVKGGIIDVFLSSMDVPVRLDFFGDRLESIREFDIESQVSAQEIDSVTVYPRGEIILYSREKDELTLIFQEAIEKGLRLSEEAESKATDNMLYGFRGLQDYFHEVIPSASLLSYIGEEPLIVFAGYAELISRRNSIESVFNEMFFSGTSGFYRLKPERLLDTAAFEKAEARALVLQGFTSRTDAFNWRLKSITGFSGRLNFLREKLKEKLNAGWDVIVTTGFEGQARRLSDLLSDIGTSENFSGLDPASRFNIVVSPLREGLEAPDIGVYIVSDQEIFGKSYRKTRAFRKKHSRPIESFLDLKKGDPVVHINHGVGIFRGIERMSAGGVERDFLFIEYAGSDRLFVPLDQITMVQKYIGSGGETPRLNFLGNKSSWNKIKARVKESVEEIAAELVEIYSRRGALKGFQYPPDTQWQEEFEALFEYEETADQITAIEDVKDDMESSKPMDRLICGDVGFGKTEVAIRASFKAVMAGRQVALLAPTTILVLQHSNTFKKRFAAYPMEIDMISRFRDRAEISGIKKRLKEGRIDIIIGTHALLASDVDIKNLGLLIIDEEQKFGVRHKERLKKLRTQVDVLTLSATPIPRTLHMSMTGIRDLSAITTPPENRQSIETYVMEENPDIMKRAILRELERKGQVFFVHNRVKSISARAAMVEKLVPSASICVAHGQMDENVLEDIMKDFLEGKYDILVSTAIIESGLDIPSVNTIIIDRADTFGLSQLHQLKGRVGRSDRKAYAYLFYPSHSSLTEDAMKRLQVISEYSDIGSGFQIAMKDLEIRGAGNILGREQSGNIMDVGFELYCQMLDESVKKLRGEKSSVLFRTPVFINADFYIPGDYIADERQKIEFYKRLESCSSEEEVDEIEREMTDRFGEAPEKVKVLIELEKIRALASALMIDEILEDSRSIRIKITGASLVDASRLVPLISAGGVRLDPSDPEILVMKTGRDSLEKKLASLKKLLQQIS